MSVSAATLKMLLLGEDRSLSKTLKGAGDAAEGTGRKMHSMSGLVKGALAAGAGLAIVKFGKDSVDAFTNVGVATLGMQRRIGGTPEEVSRLNFALKQTGISAETAQKGFGIFEKNLVNATASSKAAGTMVKNLGFEFRDAHGHVKPMADILPQVAERFSKMPAGAEKTALAMKLFGKSGADLLPFLNKGTKGLSDLEAMSDKFGHTLTNNDLVAIKENKKAHREWTAAVEGVQIQFGAKLLPILNVFMSFLVGTALPAITSFTGFLGDNKTALMAAGGAVLFLVAATKAHSVAMAIQTAGGIVKLIASTRIVTAMTSAWTAVQWLLNAALLANPIGLIIIAIAALTAGIIYAYKNSETFRNIVTKAFELVKLGAIALALMAVKSFHFMLNVWLTVAGGIINAAAWAFGWVPGLGPKLQGAAAGFNRFKDQVNASLSKIETDLTVQLNTGGAKRAADSLASYVRSRNYTVTMTVLHPQIAKLTLPGHARGGTNLPEGWALVGEEGPELRYNPAGSTIIPAKETAAILAGRSRGITGRGSSAGAGDVFVATINLRTPDGRLMQQELLTFKRQLGGGTLGLA